MQVNFPEIVQTEGVRPATGYHGSEPVSTVVSVSHFVLQWRAGLVCAVQ